MKKNYIHPAVSQVTIVPMTMIAQSITSVSNEGGPGVGGTTGDYNVGSGNSKERRDNGGWDEGGLW